MSEVPEVVNIAQTEIKKKRGRPINPVRHSEDGKVYNGPLDPEYFKKYWARMPRKQCEKCLRIVLSGKMERHYKSTACTTSQKWLEENNKTTSENTTQVEN